MKNKLRNISVSGAEYVYWCFLRTTYQLNLSPKHNKTTVVTIVVQYDHSLPEQQSGFWTFHSLKAQKENRNVILKVTQPDILQAL